MIKVDDQHPTSLDKRAEPRFKTRLSAMVTTPYKESTSVIVGNISLSGLQFFTNPEGLTVMVPNFRRENSAEKIEVDIEFFVPISTEQVEHPVKVRLKASIVYIRRVHINVFAVGCAFTEFIGNAESNLTDYFYYFGEPAE